MKLRYPFLLFILLIAGAAELSATHNRAGEITYVQIGELTIRATITTYTKTSSQDADRDSLEMVWGDGTSLWIQRSNGSGEALPNDIKVNYYTAEHTYPGRGTYTMSMRDKNRIGGIENVNSSITVPFYVETQLTFLNPQFQGFNNSVVLLQPPIDFACAGQRFIHNPNAYDQDGDSISYELVVPQQGIGDEVPLYKFPDEISPGPNNVLTLDPVTGDLVWDAPVINGDYNIAIRINEYREGVFINSVIRDLQILVAICENEPPVVDVIEEICVVAGETLVVDVVVTDPDEGQMVALTASGGPFEVDSEAVLEAPEGYTAQPLQGQFIWNTTCSDISEDFYQVVFRGVDNFNNTTGLADLKTLRIKVVGPAPDEVDAESSLDAITVFWENPYECEVTDDEFFQGFSVWRKENRIDLPADTCDPGLEGKGYEKIIFLTNEKDGDRYFAVDDSVEKGLTYCYRVLAEFAKSSPTGNPFNKVQSLPSKEICVQLNRDLPLITHVTVDETSTSQGLITVAWTKPLARDLDTLLNPGPYRYQLERAVGINGTDFTEVSGANVTSMFFNSTIDTQYVDAGLNTSDQAYNYRIQFYVAGAPNPYGESKPASSVFLEVEASDRFNVLTWDYQVPWLNFESIIYRFDNATQQYLEIDRTDESTFTDTGLDNGVEYCYKIETVGSYGIVDLQDSLSNFSQRACGIPNDFLAPCAPSLTVSNICDEATDLVDEDEIFNNLSWDRPDLVCEKSSDLAGYRIYFTPLVDQELSLIEDISIADQTDFEHIPVTGVSGCYAISSYDFSGNESAVSNLVCVENCPVFELPNAFTPNGDGSNDIYEPSNIRFIDSVDFEVYNRWGNKVFSTNDPKLNWTGENMKGGELADGVYYFTCRIYEQSTEGRQEQNEVLSGYIQLVRSK